MTFRVPGLRRNTESKAFLTDSFLSAALVRLVVICKNIITGGALFRDGEVKDICRRRIKGKSEKEGGRMITKSVDDCAKREMATFQPCKTPPPKLNTIYPLPATSAAPELIELKGLTYSKVERDRDKVVVNHNHQIKAPDIITREKYWRRKLPRFQLFSRCPESYCKDCVHIKGNQHSLQTPPAQWPACNATLSQQQQQQQHYSHLPDAPFLP